MPADTNELRSLAAGDRYYWSTYYSGCENDYYGTVSYSVYSKYSCDQKELDYYSSYYYGYKNSTNSTVELGPVAGGIVGGACFLCIVGFFVIFACKTGKCCFARKTVVIKQVV